MGKKRKLDWLRVGCAIFFLAPAFYIGVHILTFTYGRALPDARQVRARGDIEGIELALTKLASDANIPTLRDLFDPVQFTSAQQTLASREGMNTLSAATALYTSAAYALLHQGRHVLKEDTVAQQERGVDPAIFNAQRVGKLGTSYLEIGTDPWGHRYRVYPGPWPEEAGPVPFRRRTLSESEADSPDAFTVTLEQEDGVQQLGFPAPNQRLVYVWSYGRNRRNDQPHTEAKPLEAPTARHHYRGDAAAKDLGGGDDINNWDPARTWEPLHKGVDWGYELRRLFS